MGLLHRTVPTAKKRLLAGPSGPPAPHSLGAHRTMDSSENTQRRLRLGALPTCSTRKQKCLLAVLAVFLCWLTAIWLLSSKLEISSVYLDGNRTLDNNLIGLIRTVGEARALSIPVNESRMALFSAVERVASGGSGAVPGPLSSGMDVLEWELFSALEGIGREANVLGCHMDSGVLDARLPVEGVVLLSANLRNSESIMPNFMLQLLRFVGRLPQGAVVVSIYESGSTDQTWVWLDVLRRLLDFADVPNNVTFRGGLIRGRSENRIGFLAKVRNAVLDPFIRRGPSQGLSESSDTSLTTHWDVDKVVFVNDVFFCAHHIFRLARHDADIACGLDFVRRMNGLSKEDQRLLMVKDLSTSAGLPLWFINFASHWYWLLKQWRRYLGRRSYVLRHIPLIFYDKWVSHDMNGKQFLNYPPYVSDEYGAARLKDGLPFPAQCCWNGLVVFTAAPFQAGIHFRNHEPGECAGSECFLMCHDFFRLGYGKVVVDPGVRVAYTYDDAVGVYSEDLVRNIGFVSWGEAESKAIDQPPRALETVECCDLQEGKEIVDFEHGCHDFSVDRKNFTKIHLDAISVGEDS